MDVYEVSPITDFSFTAGETDGCRHCEKHWMCVSLVTELPGEESNGGDCLSCSLSPSVRDSVFARSSAGNAAGSWTCTKHRTELVFYQVVETHTSSAATFSKGCVFNKYLRSSLLWRGGALPPAWAFSILLKICVYTLLCGLRHFTLVFSHCSRGSLGTFERWLTAPRQPTKEHLVAVSVVAPEISSEAGVIVRTKKWTF